MKKIAIVFHSGYGHTLHFAKHVLEGAASVKNVKVELISTDDASKNLDQLSQYDGLIFGSPTYMGNVSGQFKVFMDSTSGIWQKQGWKNKFAAGFTVSGSPSGDKQTSLISLAVFAAQHGMLWIGNAIMPEIYQGVKAEDAANRLGSFLGAMAQAANQAPETSFLPGDLKTARLFGERVAQVVATQD